MISPDHPLYPARLPQRDALYGVRFRLHGSLVHGFVVLFLADLVFWWVYSWLIYEIPAPPATALLALSSLIHVLNVAVLWLVSRWHRFDVSLLAFGPLRRRHALIAVLAAVVSLAIAYIPAEYFGGTIYEWEPAALAGPGDAWALAMTWLFVGCVMVPISEELIFRGWIQPALMQAGLNLILAVVLTALLFGILHPDWVQATISGVIFGALRHYTGRLAAPILAHALHNSVVFLDTLIRFGPEGFAWFV